MLRTPVGLAMGAVVVLGAGAVFIGFIKAFQLARNAFDEVTDAVLGG